MNNNFISLNEAALISNKSTQTIRRMVKSNKLKYRRRRTPQGFVYFVDKQSLAELFDLKFNPNEDTEFEEEAEDLDLKNDDTNYPKIYSHERDMLPSDLSSDYSKNDFMENNKISNNYKDLYSITNFANLIDYESDENFKKSILRSEKNGFHFKSPEDKEYFNYEEEEWDDSADAAEITNEKHTLDISNNQKIYKLKQLMPQSDFSEIKKHYSDLITQKDILIEQLKQEIETLKADKQNEIERNKDLLKKCSDQIEAINKLSTLCEILQGRLKLYEQKLLAPPKKWWNFWINENN